jgi:murein DD-endopeptidase MepM/ murein hydrolase activator NlpD
MRFISVHLILLFCCVRAGAQLFQPVNYPETEFRNPLSIPISLSANFGELRSNHYHMGLDIRTQHRVNLPVHAAADGYVYKIKVEPFGFGQAVYIRHSNGYVTLYAHLNAFYPALAAYVKKKQYELERWNVFLDIPPGLFPVKKGDLIAYSGSTGGSLGPHLHFEIREYPEDINLNPMLFGLPIPDNKPPVVRRLAVYDRNKSIYEQAPDFYPVKGAGKDYHPERSIIYTGSPNVGFGISGFDTQTGSSNPNGIYQAVIYDNQVAISGFRMNHISYNDTRGINAHIDYRTRAGGGPYYQLLFRLPGYAHSIYQEHDAGYIGLEDGKPHDIRIELKDARGNSSSLRFKVQYKPGEKINPAYEGKMFYPGMIDGYETDDCAFYLGEGSLYDSVHVAYHAKEVNTASVVSRLHQIGTPSVPVQDSITVRIKITKPVADKNRVLMQWFSKENGEVKKVQWQDGWATAAFRNFGNFQLVTDTEPPSISIPGIAENANLQKSSHIAVRVHDNFEQIKSFRATLDGNWLLFSNDKAKAFIYHFDAHCSRGKHELKITATDEAGNVGEKVLHFVR